MANMYFIHISPQNNVDIFNGALWHSTDGIILTTKIKMREDTKILIKEHECKFDKNLHHEIEEGVFRLLLDAQPNIRIKIYNSKEGILDLLKKMEVGSYVLITKIGDDHNITGTIQCKFFELYDESEAIETDDNTNTIWKFYRFGIKLDDAFKEIGESDGIFYEHRFFYCDEDCATFCSAYKLHPLQIKVGDQVSWIDDRNIINLAVVKWIGFLPDRENILFAGIEFEFPIGSGTGKYKKTKLFEAKKNHASIVPLNGLFKAEINDDSFSLDNGETSVLESNKQNLLILKNDSIKKNFTNNISNEIYIMCLRALFMHNSRLTVHLKNCSNNLTFRGRCDSKLLQLISNLDETNKFEVEEFLELIKFKHENIDLSTYITFIEIIYKEYLELEIHLFKFDIDKIVTNYDLYATDFLASILTLSSKGITNTCFENNVQEILNVKFDEDFIFFSTVNNLPLLIIKIEDSRIDLKFNINLNELFFQCSFCKCINDESKINGIDYILCKDCIQSRKPESELIRQYIFCSKKCHNNFTKNEDLTHPNQINLHQYLNIQFLINECNSKSLTPNKNFWLYSFISNLNEELILCTRNCQFDEDWIVYSHDGSHHILNLKQHIGIANIPSKIAHILSHVEICFYAPNIS